MQNFLKRISFFLIYLPALIFACQYAYYSGLCEPLNVSIFSLGLNPSEVSVLGYLNTSLLTLQTFNKVALHALYLIIFIIITFIFHLLAVHPSESKNESYRIEALISQLQFELPQWKFRLNRFFDTFIGIFLIYSSIFILTIFFILYYYEKGKNELTVEFHRIEMMSTCNYKEGYVILNDKRIRTEPILCGNYKCYGIDLENKEVFTYLPENYRSPLFLRN